jgi:hypothetical protein
LKGREDDKEEASSYWTTVRKKNTEIEGGSTRLPSVESTPGILRWLLDFLKMWSPDVMINCSLILGT